MMHTADNRSQTDAGTARSDKRAVLRKCAVTREVREKDELIRFARGPDGTVVPDVLEKLPGRGVWVGCDRETVAQAVKANVFARAFRATCRPSEELPKQVDDRLLKRTQEYLSLANKAGLVVTGHGKVESAIGSGAIACLVQACDGSKPQRSGLRRAFEARAKRSGRDPLSIEVLTIRELSLALGRENVVHAALKESRLTTSFVRAAFRLARYRAMPARNAIEPSRTNDNGSTSRGATAVGQTNAVEKQD